MVQTIITSLIGCVVSAIFGFLIGKLKKFKKDLEEDENEKKLLKNGVKMLLQSNLTNVFYIHNELGQIEDYKLKNWYNELHEYEALGGNDYMHVLEKKMARLKIVHTDILNND